MLGSKNMIRQPEQSSVRFRPLADNDADQANNQYDKLLNLVKYEKNDQFHNFNFTKDGLDSFLANYLISDSYKDLWHIYKLIFTSDDQSNVERGFSVNKEVLQDSLQVKSPISQLLIYDTLICTDSELHSFVSPYHLHFIKAENSRFRSTKQI